MEKGFNFDLQLFADPEKKVATFGIAALQIRKMLTDPKDGTATYDPNWIDLPIQDINMAVTVNRIKEKGDEVTLNVEPVIDTNALTWSNAQIPFTALAAINGSTHAANAEGQTFLLEKGEDVPAQFEMRAVTKKTYGGKGPLGIYIPKATGILSVLPKSGDFANCSFDGEYMARKSDKKLRGFIILNVGQSIEDISEELFVAATP